MSRNKKLSKKKKLAKAKKQNRRIPLWVLAKTKMNVRRNPKRRNWRRSDLDI